MDCMEIPQVLCEISKYLKSQNVHFSSQFEDGRINSVMNEDEVIKIIAKEFDIIPAKARNWFDFCIETKNDFYPVNIKITDTTHADNLNCKLGIYYALTGILPDFSNEIPWISYFEKIKGNFGLDKHKDYYFLVCNKNNSKDVFVNSLKELQNLQPNGNNLPFQCKWNDNRKYYFRSFDEAQEFILSVFGESVKLRTEIYFSFKKHFPQYV